MQPRTDRAAADVPPQHRAVRGVIHSPVEYAGCEIDQDRLGTDNGKAAPAIFAGTVRTGWLRPHVPQPRRTARTAEMPLPARRFHGCYGMVEGKSCKQGPRVLSPPAPSQFAIDAISVAMTAQQCGQREHFERSQLRVARKAGTNQTYRDGASGTIPGMGSTGGNACPTAAPAAQSALLNSRGRSILRATSGAAHLPCRWWGPCQAAAPS